ncbi:MFS transporter [Sphingomonas oryzagri]
MRAPADHGARVTPDPAGLVAALLMALLAASGLFYVNIMPALVSGLEQGLGFTARQAGIVWACNVYGAAGGAIFAALIAWRWPWRPTVAGALVLLIVVDLLSTQVTSFVPLATVRVVHGCIGGVVTGIGFSVIARAPVPDRVYGMLLFVQFGLGGLGVAVLPRLVGHFGASILFLALVGLALVALVTLPFVPSLPRTIASPVALASTASGRRGNMGLAFVALFLFQAAHMGLSAYLLDIGGAAGLPAGFVSATAGVAGALGALGSLGVVYLGMRHGRAKPLGAAMTLALVSGLLLLGARHLPLFAIAVLLGSVTWTFALPFLLGLCTAFDASGRSAIWSSVVSKLGLATGPLVAALIGSGSGFSPLVVCASSAVLVAMLAVIPSARSGDREETSRSGHSG